MPAKAEGAIHYVVVFALHAEVLAMVALTVVLEAAYTRVVLVPVVVTG